MKHAGYAALFLVSFLFLCAGVSPSLSSVLDEGIMLYGAERVLQGDVQYRDFFSLYAPAQFWVLSWLFKIFGTSVLAARFWDIFVRAGIALLVYLLVRRFGSRTAALCAWFPSLLWLWLVESYEYPLLPATFFVLLSTWGILSRLEGRGGRAPIIGSGFSLGIAALFRHDLGFLGFVAGALALFAFSAQERFSQTARGDHSCRRGEGLREVCMLAFGALLAGLPAVFYLLWHVPVADLLENLFVLPATVYPGVRRLPYPSIIAPFGQREWLSSIGGWGRLAYSLLLVLPYYLHLFALIMAIVLMLRVWCKGEREPILIKYGLGVLYLALLVSFVFLKALVRPHYIQFSHIIVISLIMLGVFLCAPRAALGRSARACCGLLLFSMCLLPLSVMLPGSGHSLLDFSFSQTFSSSSVRLSKIEKAGAFSVHPDQASAIEEVKRMVPPGQHIFVGNGRHDRIFINDVLFYFLADRPSATKYHELHPGVATTADVQQRIISELISRRVQVIVLWEGVDEVNEPNLSSVSSGVHLLDDFLKSNYTEVVRFGHYSVRERANKNQGSTLAAECIKES